MKLILRHTDGMILSYKKKVTPGEEMIIAD